MNATPYMTLKRPYPFGTDHAPILHYGQPQYARDITPIDELLRLLGSVRLIQSD